MDNYQEQVRIFKAFCDENRLRILEQLHGGERCACMLLEALQIQQPTLSHHMKILCDAEIVVGRKEGKWMHYSLSPAGGRMAQTFLQHYIKLDDEDAQASQP